MEKAEFKIGKIKKYIISPVLADVNEINSLLPIKNPTYREFNEFLLSSYFKFFALEAINNPPIISPHKTISQFNKSIKFIISDGRKNQVLNNYVKTDKSEE